MMLKKQVILIVVILLITSGLISCGNDSQNPNIVETSTKTLISTDTPFPASTFTNTPTNTPTPTQIPTASQTNTPTSTAVPTATTLPTLSSEGAAAFALELLQTNAGCDELPCWWGFTPGVTRWETASRILETFTQIDIRAKSENDKRAYVSIPVPEEHWADEYPLRLTHSYTFRDGIIDEINIWNYELTPWLWLTEFLNVYGKPEEVWLVTRPVIEGDETHQGFPVGVALFYPDKGIVITYYTSGEFVGDQVKGCPQAATTPFLGLWSPGRGMTFAEAKKTFRISEEKGYPFKPLSEVTDLSVETFYETFVNPNNTTCIYTPLELWELK